MICAVVTSLLLIVNKLSSFVSLMLGEVVETFTSRLGSFSTAGVTCMARKSISPRIICVDVLTGTSGTVASYSAELESVGNVGGISALPIDDTDSGEEL